MNPNDPAFLQEPKRFHDPESFGLTKREYFAALAMQGMMTLQPNDMISWADLKEGTVGDWVAKNSVQMADALIKELSKKPFTEQTEEMK